jgi:hypothetical protein
MIVKHKEDMFGFEVMDCLGHIRIPETAQAGAHGALRQIWLAGFLRSRRIPERS